MKQGVPVLQSYGIVNVNDNNTTARFKRKLRG